jgi:hypothetical protein
MGETYHTVYSIDANADTFDDICQELEDIGGVNQNDWGTEKHNQAMQNMDKRIAENKTTYNNGYSAGVNYRPPASDNSMSAWDGFKEGFTSVIDFAKFFF